MDPCNNTCIITLFHVNYKPGVRVSSGRISESKKSIVNKWNDDADLTTKMKKSEVVFFINFKYYLE